VLYAINELDNTISVYGHEPATGRLTARQTISTLPEGVTPTTFTADLRLTPDGRFLYGTNRGHDSIAAYALAADGSLALVEIVPSLGKGPQNLAITPDGSLLLCANMPGNNVAIFQINPQTGELKPHGDTVPQTGPSCLMVVDK
jgi:6-phosphogluconolactonase